MECVGVWGALARVGLCAPWGGGGNSPLTMAPYHTELLSPITTSPTTVAEEATNPCLPFTNSRPLIGTTRVEGTTEEERRGWGQVFFF